MESSLSMIAEQERLCKLLDNTESRSSPPMKQVLLVQIHHPCSCTPEVPLNHTKINNIVCYIIGQSPGNNPL